MLLATGRHQGIIQAGKMFFLLHCYFLDFNLGFISNIEIKRIKTMKVENEYIYDHFQLSTFNFQLN